MVPPTLRDDVTSGAERRLYAALRDQLSAEFTVLHGVRWLLRQQQGHDQDGEIDFLLVHRGLGLLLIEVKGGQISIDGASGTWFSTDRSGVRHRLSRSPFEQVMRNLYSLKRKLEEAPATAPFVYRFRRAVAVPDGLVGALAAGIDVDRELIIDSADIGQLDAVIRRSYGRPHRDESMSEAAHVTLLTLLQPAGDVSRPALGYRIAESEEQIVTLSARQLQLLNVLRAQRQVLIAGCAGSGKTLLAVTKATQLAAEGFRVLLTCFNKNLATWLQAHVAASPAAKRPGSLTVLHYHGLVEALCAAAGVALPRLPATADAVATGRYWNETLPELLAEITPHLATRYDAIIADEGQDFRGFWWLTLQDLLASRDDGVLYIFYAENQMLYSGELEFPIATAPFFLHDNYRNTGPIHDLSVRFYEGDPKPGSFGPTGPLPDIRPVTQGTGHDALRQVLDELVRQEGIAHSNIVILTPRSERSSAFRAGERFGTTQLTWNPVARGNEIRISTIHAFKGLESPVVILVEANQLPRHTDRADLLYVALSRARSHLIVLGDLDEITALAFA